MRKMAVELASGKDGKQGGGDGKMEFPLIAPTCPEVAGRGPLGGLRRMNGPGGFVRVGLVPEWPRSG